MSDEIEKIKQAAEKYDKQTKEKKSAENNQRLKELVAEYGIDRVVAATGLSAGSVVLYTTRNTAHHCSDYALEKAVTILKQ